MPDERKSSFFFRGYINQFDQSIGNILKLLEERNIRFAQISSILRPFFGKRKERSLQVNAQKISIVVSHNGVVTGLIGVAGLIGIADGRVGIAAGLGGGTDGPAGIAAGHIGITVGPAGITASHIGVTGILAISAGRL